MSDKMERIVNIIAIVLIIAISVSLAIFLNIHNTEDSELFTYLCIILINPIIVPLIIKEYERFKYKGGENIPKENATLQKFIKLKQERYLQEKYQKMEEEKTIKMEREVPLDILLVNNDNIYESEQVSLSYISEVLKSMEYEEVRIDGDYLYFKERDCEYRLYLVWVPLRQVNLMAMDFFYCNAETVEQNFLRDLACDLANLRVTGKVRLIKDEDIDGSCQVLISSDTILMHKRDVRLIILSLINCIISTTTEVHRRREKFLKLQNNIAVNDIDQQVALHNNRAKYEC